MRILLVFAVWASWNASLVAGAGGSDEGPGVGVPQVSSQPATDLSGTWIAKANSPMGEMEIVYELKLQNGHMTGKQILPFGESPIVDGTVSGDSFHFTVKLDAFGNTTTHEVTGRIVGDTIVLTPAFPGPPRGGGLGEMGPALANGAGPPAGAGPAGPPPFHIGEVTARRGTPTPSYRRPSVDYAHLAKAALPALHPVAANGLALTPPMGWNSWNKFQTHIDDAIVRAIADAMATNGMKDAGYQYVIIDDGWQGARDSAGNISPNPNFPDMKALADYVHSKGLKIGIYSSPGPRTCGGFEGAMGTRSWMQ